MSGVGKKRPHPVRQPPRRLRRSARARGLAPLTRAAVRRAPRASHRRTRARSRTRWSSSSPRPSWPSSTRVRAPYVARAPLLPRAYPLPVPLLAQTTAATGGTKVAAALHKVGSVLKGDVAKLAKDAKEAVMLAAGLRGGGDAAADVKKLEQVRGAQA